MAVVLVVEDDSIVRMAFVRALQGPGYTVLEAGSVAEALRIGADQHVDLLVIDLMLPDGSGLDVFDRLNAARPGIPALIVTGFGNEEAAFAAGRRGIKGYFRKPVSMQELSATVDDVLAELGVGPRAAGAGGALGRIVGTSRAVEEVRTSIVRFAREPDNVLIRGETGTGKELTARALHEQSPRRAGPYVPVNCAAITDSLFESELFGHERGAFTGAVARHAGLFEAAHGGTLFLDEVAEMSAGLQAKLLRALDEGAIRRVGSTHPIPVDVRIVAATNRHLSHEIAAGRFREDLLHRLDQLSIRLPPLRARPEDIPAIVAHLLADLGRRRGRGEVRISGEALRVLEAFSWPGNIRQLENIVRRVLAEIDRPVIEAGHVTRHLSLPLPAVPGPPDAGLPFGDGSLRATLEAAERWRIQRALEGNATLAAAAKELAIEERTLYNKRRRLGLG